MRLDLKEKQGNINQSIFFEGRGNGLSAIVRISVSVFLPKL